MAELKPWPDLPAGGIVRGDDAPGQRTGTWRTGLKPRVNRSACVNCLLCWLYCPDAAVVVKDGVFAGFDYHYCKGCEICAEMCAAGAIEMVPEATDVD